MKNKIINMGPLQIVTEESPLLFGAIYLGESNVLLCEKGIQSILVRTYNAVSEPVLLTECSILKENSSQVQWLLTDISKKYTCKLDCWFTKTGLHYRAEYDAPEPIWLTEWSLSGLDFDKLIVPALGGQVISDQMPEETTLSYKYPFWLNAQFVLGIKGYDGLCVHSRDTSTNLKLLRIRREKKRFTLTYGFEAPAQKKCRHFVTEWFVDGFEDDWRIPVADYRNWMATAFHAQSLKHQTSMPDWARKINFILELWGARRESPNPHHNYDQMIQRLKDFQDIHPPEETLVYLPGFAEHGIDSHIPDYNPSSLLGGEKGFTKLVDTAHDLGYHVMIHTNVLGMTYSHPDYQAFKKYQVIDAFGRRQGWGMDMDGDWITEPYFAYINPGEDAWNEKMKKTLGRLITDFSVDGVFLDQTLLAFNVRQGPDFIQGMRKHIRSLQKAFPQTLFAGEGLHEQVLECFSMAQIHGIDSLSDVHGMEGQKPWREIHPVSTFLFNGYTHYMAHLLTKHPSHPQFKLQESAYERLNVIPTLSLYDHTQKMDLSETRRMIYRAKHLHEEE